MMEQVLTSVIGIGVVIILLLFFIIYERQKRQELERLVGQQTKVIRNLERYATNIENDFVLLEGRVETIDEEVRELQQKQLNP